MGSRQGAAQFAHEPRPGRREPAGVHRLAIVKRTRQSLSEHAHSILLPCEARRRMNETAASGVQSLRPARRLMGMNAGEAPAEIADRPAQRSAFRRHERCGACRRRGAHIGDKIADREVGFVTYA